MSSFGKFNLAQGRVATLCVDHFVEGHAELYLFKVSSIRAMSKRREECNTYLTHICRHHWSRKSLVKRLKLRSFQPTLLLSSAVDKKPQCWLKAVSYSLSFHLVLSAKVMSSDMSQVGITLFPSFYHITFPGFLLYLVGLVVSLSDY